MTEYAPGPDLTEKMLADLLEHVTAKSGPNSCSCVYAPLIANIIAEVRRRRASSSQYEKDHKWQCSRCGEHQPGEYPPYPSKNPCEACGAPMCQRCREEHSCCNETCAGR